MMLVQVREFATITTDNTQKPSLDLGVVKKATFEWLVETLNHSSNKEKVIVLKDSKVLKLANHVGFLQSPNGEALEILPKTGYGDSEPKQLRQILRQMLIAAMSTPHREVGSADLSRMDCPIHEWIFAQFLHELKSLIMRGLRFDYERVDEKSHFLRGQLQVAKQIVKMPGRNHIFDIQHDVFTPNRIENRIIKTALELVKGQCKTPQNWRLANELSHRLTLVRKTLSPLKDLSLWQSNKLMQHYDGIKPWCRLILEQFNPNFQKGQFSGISLLFPMEKLFEKYVEFHLHKRLDHGFYLKPQAATEYMVSHKRESDASKLSWFQLNPDLMLCKSNSQYRQVMDMKWKLLNSKANNGQDKYGISQADIYQLFAYGEKYQNGTGHMMLVYPKHRGFNHPLPKFSFNQNLHLWVVPFCIEEKCLVSGEWHNHFAIDPPQLNQKAI